MTISGGTGTEVLRAGFLRGVPLDLPENAEFSNPRGDFRHWGVGGALVHEVSRPGSERRWTWKAGLLYDRVEVKGYEMDYRLLGGANAGTRGVLGHSSSADFLTPYFGIQRTLPLGKSWVLAPRFVAGVPVPGGDFDGRLTGPGFDLSTTRSAQGRPAKIGDGFAGFSAGLIHLRSGLEIDLGATLFYPVLEKVSHPGVDKALLLQVAWHF
jgi:hypothetical protein